jgi:hypothetical protein
MPTEKTSQEGTPADDGRDETVLERRDRNLGELLQELRVVQTGVQVLFAFLLTVPFTQRFDRLDAAQRALYFATLLAAAISIILLIAPTAWHRWLFALGDKEHLVLVAHRLSLVGVGFVGLTIIGVVLLIATTLYPGIVAITATVFVTVICTVLWAIAPLARRRPVNRRHR